MRDPGRRGAGLGSGSASPAEDLDAQAHPAGDVAGLTELLHGQDASLLGSWLIESSCDAIATLTLDGTITTWNAAAQRIYGYSVGEAIGASATLLAPDDTSADELRRALDRVRAGETVGPIEAVRRRRDGTLIDVSITLSPVRDADGAAVVGLASISRDISESKRVERELKRGRERLEQAELTARMGSWDWDPVSDHVSCSTGLNRLFGLPPEIDGGLARRTLDERVHAGDRASVRCALDRAVAELTPSELAFRAVGQDGRVRFFDGRVEPIADERTGQLVRLIGVAYDVTEARRAQDALNAASSGLAQYAQELHRLAGEQGLAVDAHASVALTTRQLEIVQLVARGLTNAEIAQRIAVSEGTVKWHVKQILHKTGAANRTEAVARVLGAETARHAAVDAS